MMSDPDEYDPYQDAYNEWASDNKDELLEAFAESNEDKFVEFCKEEYTRMREERWN